jgi:hypothetical protein
MDEALDRPGAASIEAGPDGDFFAELPGGAAGLGRHPACFGVEIAVEQDVVPGDGQAHHATEAAVGSAAHPIGQIGAAVGAEPEIAAVIAAGHEAVAAGHVLPGVVEDAAVGKLGERGLAGAEHGEGLAGLPDRAAVVAVEGSAVVIGTPLCRIGVLRPRDPRRHDEPSLVLAKGERDTALHGNHANTLAGNIAESIRSSLHGLSRPTCAVIATAKKPASTGIGVEQVARAFIHQAASVDGIRSDQDFRFPRPATVPAAPAGAPAGGLKRHHRAVLRRQDAAPAAAFIPDLLDRDKKRRPKELLQRGSSGESAASFRLCSLCVQRGQRREQQGGKNGEGGFHGLFYETVRHQLVFLGFAEIK